MMSWRQQLRLKPMTPEEIEKTAWMRKTFKVPVNDEKLTIFAIREGEDVGADPKVVHYTLKYAFTHGWLEESYVHYDERGRDFFDRWAGVQSFRNGVEAVRDNRGRRSPRRAFHRTKDGTLLRGHPI